MKPDFLIVGAPRCGTTAMYGYLRRHPQVFMPDHKEPLYFGSDLNHLHGRLTEDEYRQLFRGAGPGQRRGEASTWYLYSTTAAAEMRDFIPAVRLIVMLRNPVDVMYSLHREMLFHRAETIEDFEEALRAEPERMNGRRIAARVRRVEALRYRDAVRFADQLERYLAVFPREQIKVLLYDDLRVDPATVYEDTLKFLEVDPSFRPTFEPANESKRPRSGVLQDIVIHPPAAVRQLIPRLRRYPVAHRLRSTILSLNSKKTERAPMDDQLRQRLERELAPEVARLGELIGRDLGHWSPQSQPATLAR